MFRQSQTETVLFLFLGTLCFFINKSSFCHEKLMCSPLKQKQNFTFNCYAINFLVLFAESSLNLWVICFEPHTESSLWETAQFKKITQLSLSAQDLHQKGVRKNLPVSWEDIRMNWFDFLGSKSVEFQLVEDCLVQHKVGIHLLVHTVHSWSC